MSSGHWWEKGKSPYSWTEMEQEKKKQQREGGSEADPFVYAGARDSDGCWVNKDRASRESGERGDVRVGTGTCQKPFSHSQESKINEKTKRKER